MLPKLLPENKRSKYKRKKELKRNSGGMEMGFRWHGDT